MPVVSRNERWLTKVGRIWLSNSAEPRPASSAPVMPVGPNRARLCSIVFAGALLAGLGSALLLSQIRPTFVSQRSLRETTGIPILGSISMNWTDTQRLKRRRRLYAFGLAVSLFFGGYGGVMASVLWMQR